MELTLALDAGAVVAPAPPGSAVDPNDPAAEAFAALLATLVATVAPQVPVALPEAPTAAVATEAPAAPVLPLVLALPVAAPAVVEGVEDGADPDLPAAATPVPADAPEAPAPAIPLAPAFSSPVPPQRGGGRDENGETDIELPAAPVAAPFSSPLPPQEGGQRDQNATTTPITTAPAVREIVRPEVVGGTGAPPPAPPSPVEQVVRAVAPLRKLADGTHNIVLELRPADLGVVRVELSLDRGTVHLGLQADTEGTSQLLRAALPELRAQLDTAGLLAGRLAVADGGSGRDTGGQHTWPADADGRRHGRDESADARSDEPVPSTNSSSAPGQIDVLL